MQHEGNESAKIEQLLGELGRISPPFLNSKEKLKQLAATLYLLSDQLSETPEVEAAAALETNAPLTPQEQPWAPASNLQPNHTDWSNPIPDLDIEAALMESEVPVPPAETATPDFKADSKPEPVLPPVPESIPVQEVPPAREPEILPELPAEPALPPAPEAIPTPSIPPAPKTEVLPEAPAEPILPPAPEAIPTPQIPPAPKPEVLPEAPAEPVLPPKSETTPVPPATPPAAAPTASRDLHKSLALVKRIEFINRLFSGKDDEWQRFCQQVNRAAHTEEALSIYREHFIRLGWEKQTDSADQLKQSIVKVCA